MRWVVANIHRIMILSGLLTMTMIYATLAPEAALRSTFGESVSGACHARANDRIKIQPSHRLTDPNAPRDLTDAIAATGQWRGHKKRLISTTLAHTYNSKR